MKIPVCRKERNQIPIIIKSKGNSERSTLSRLTKLKNQQSKIVAAIDKLIKLLFALAEVEQIRLLDFDPLNFLTNISCI